MAQAPNLLEAIKGNMKLTFRSANGFLYHAVIDQDGNLEIYKEGVPPVVKLTSADRDMLDDVTETFQRFLGDVRDKIDEAYDDAQDRAKLAA